MAADLINSRNLSFAVLFTLLPETRLFTVNYNLRNCVAIALCENVISNAEPFPDLKKQLSISDDYLRSSLKWVFITGASDDGLSDDYDRVMDIAASILLKTYHETSILSKAINLVFERNRRGRYINDLLWAVFCSREPKLIDILRSFLHSGHKSDRLLARKILGFICRDANLPSEMPMKQLNGQNFGKWLRENAPFMYFTGEGFHRTSEPAPCMVNYDAKYIGKKVTAESGLINADLSESECRKRDEFHNLSYEEKQRLADYSKRLRSVNHRKWVEFMGYSLEKQLNIVKSNTGGAL